MPRLEVVPQEPSLELLHGIVGKTQKAIDNIYKDLEDEWPERSEVERRFRYCMEDLDNALGSELANTAFTNRAAFHALFATVYDAAFKIGSSLKKEKAEPLHADFKARVLKTSDTIRAAKAPDKVMESLARRTTHKDSRKTVLA